MIVHVGDDVIQIVEGTHGSDLTRSTDTGVVEHVAELVFDVDHESVDPGAVGQTEKIGPRGGIPHGITGDSDREELQRLHVHLDLIGHAVPRFDGIRPCRTHKSEFAGHRPLDLERTIVLRDIGHTSETDSNTGKHAAGGSGDAALEHDRLQPHLEQLARRNLVDWQRGRLETIGRDRHLDAVSGPGEHRCSLRRHLDR